MPASPEVPSPPTDRPAVDRGPAPTALSEAGFDPGDPEAAIAVAARRWSNWGRWGEHDVLGTLNFITDTHRADAARLIRHGTPYSLALEFTADGPQNGWRRRTNPVHTMLDTGTDAARDNQGFPHGFGGADDVVFMPLQCGTQWDGLGHIFDHGRAWNGRDAAEVVTSAGDQVTGMQHLADRVLGRGVLLDVGRALRPGGELADGYAVTAADLERTIRRQGSSARVGTADLVLVRTGQLARVKREGWGSYAGGAAPGLSFTTAGWLHERQVAALATDTWGFEVRPNEFHDAFQPLHQVVIPHLGLLIGEMWDLEALSLACAGDGVYDFFLSAPPLPITGAVGSPLTPIAVR